MVLVSFIIPYYNVPLQFVVECVESIMQLGLKEDEREIIVVDDGSDTDISGELTRHDSNILYIRQENGGPGVARNTGMKVAKGEYIQFVDSDDKLVPSVYCHCVEMLRKGMADLLMFGFVNGKSRLRQSCVWHGPLPGSEYMTRKNLKSPVWGYCFRTTLLDDIKFPTGIHEDEEFTTLLVLKARKVMFTEATAYFYRMRENSITTIRNSSHIIKRLDDVERILGVLKSKEEELHGTALDGMRRKVAQLTADYIFNAVRLTKSMESVDKRVERLREMSLYPMPCRRYSIPYYIFSHIANRRAGLRLFALFLPLIGGKR